MTTILLILLGLLLALLPAVSRRGLLFGAHVGEEASESPAARRLRWTYGAAMLLLTAAVVWLAPPRPVSSGWPIWVLCLGFLALYVPMHLAARRLGPGPEAAPPEPGPAPRSGGGGGLVALGAMAVAIGLWALLDARAYMPRLPERIPVHFDLAGEPDGWARRSPATVYLLPALALVLGSGTVALGWLVRGAARSTRRGDDGRSAAAQERFHRFGSLFLGGTGVFVAALMATLSMGSVRVAAGDAATLGSGVALVGGAFVAYVIGGVIVLFAVHGQGGARLEGDAADAPLTGSVADDRHWYLGLVYANRADPAWFVEHRFGLGWTINFGNWKAVTALVLFLAVSLAGPLLLVR